jgi:hypothetical protein
MIRNGLYSLNATSRDGVDGDVGGVLILATASCMAATPTSITQEAMSALLETGRVK